MPHCFRPPRGLLLLLLCPLLGCQAPPWPSWLPDSSGFVYVTDTGQVVQYDLERAASRTLLPAGPGRPLTVALSPDGSSAAVATAVGSPTGWAAEVRLLDLRSGELVTTISHRSGEVPNTASQQPTWASWGPQGKRLLFGYGLNPEEALNRAAVLDLETGTTRELRGNTPMMVVSLITGVSPFLPDGSGYLNVNASGDKVAWADWRGWLTPLKNDSAFKAFQRGRKKTPPFYVVDLARWDRETLRVRTSYGEIVADPTGRTVSMEPFDPQTRQRVLRHAERRQKGQYLGRVISLAEGTEAELELDSETQQTRIRFIDAKGRQRIVLRGHFAQGTSSTMPVAFGMLTPAPDGKHLLAVLAQEGKWTLSLLDASGETRMSVPVGTAERFQLEDDE